MIKVALIGAGKMGISHLSILGAHPDVKVVGVSDTSKMVIDVLKKYSSFPVFTDYKKMFYETLPDAVVVAAPSKFHAGMVMDILNNNLHVFTEKPLSISIEESKTLMDLAKQKKLVNQVGYHNKFLGTFREVKRIIDGGFLGDLFHFTGESYGPVVTSYKQNNWRSDPKEGGGCLMDYTSHVIDLLNYLLGPITKVKDSLVKSFYSKEVEDSVFSLVEIGTKLSGVISVNWSDDTYRKMTTTITVIGNMGKIICDASQLKVYFKTVHCPKEYRSGWNIKYITDLTENVEFYLRGEEYSLQIDHFIKTIQGKIHNTINTFETAWHTDRVISLIKNSVTK